jgi:ribonuclease BN (tRNA processing enzyme)
MGVRLTVIGSSPAHPNPGGAHSGYLLESDGCGRLLLDCGPGVLARLLAGDLLPIDAIAVTHFHLDHWGDLVPWAWMRLYGSAGTDPPPAVWVPPAGIEGLHVFASHWGTAGMFEGAFNVEEYSPGTPFEAAGFDIEAHPVEHYGFPSFGLRVKAPDGCVLGYSGDSAPCDGLTAIATGADLFLCEATLAAAGDDADPRGHLSADEAASVADGPLLLTHRPITLTVPAGSERARDGQVVDVQPGSRAGDSAAQPAV